MVVDDDPDICFLLEKYLARNGFQVLTAHTLKKTIELMESHPDLDVMLSDYRLDGIDGKEMLQKVRSVFPRLPVIFITGYNDLKTAVALMKMGAYDYVLKPLFPDEILNTVSTAIKENSQMEVQSNGDFITISEVRKSKAFDADYILKGKGGVFQKLEEQVELVGPTDFSIIIYGESGTGKEIIAQQIHQKSARAKKPFIAIDCGALSKELAGSELFGHEKGAFTGAISQKIGSFELANGGTIFLDEIANLPYDVQVSLLRVIQERKMKRLGGAKDILLDIRIIIASNERLWDSVGKGKFREDLYHRFNEFSIEVPPLRERKQEIMLFAQHFLMKANLDLGKKIEGFSDEVEEILCNYIWPGNLRELKNVIKRSVLLSNTEIIQAASLPFEITNFKKLSFETDQPITVVEPIISRIAERREAIASLSDKEVESNATLDGMLKGAAIDVEYDLILKTLHEVNFNKSKAARILNIDRKTLYNKMRMYQQINKKGK